MSPSLIVHAETYVRFLRKRLVGKTVHVLIDYIKPKEGDYEERECVTITYGSQATYVTNLCPADKQQHRRADDREGTGYRSATQA